MMNHYINRKQAVVVGLLYPAMLGTFFYSLFPMLQSSTGSAAVLADRLPYCVIMLSTVALYIVDYVYTASQEELDWFSFVSSFLVISLMFFAFDGVSIISHAPLLGQHCYSLALTYTVFAVVDMIHRNNYRSWWRFVVGYEIVLATAYTAFGALVESPTCLAYFSLVNALLFGIVGNVAYRPESLPARLQQVCCIFNRAYLRARAVLSKNRSVKGKPAAAECAPTPTTAATVDISKNS
jgi:hypothetical protein